MFDGILEALPDAVVGVDPSGVIQFVNHQTESLFGYGRDDLIGAPFQKLVPGSGGQVQAADLGTQAPGGPQTGTDLELSGLKADGSEFVSLGDYVLSAFGLLTTVRSQS